MFKFIHKGDFRNLQNFLTGAPKIDYKRILDVYGMEGVRALAAATPVDTGKTKNSWGYFVTVDRDRCSITWTNSNENESGTPIVILIQYGHGTRQGRYIHGRDFINPALLPTFDRIAEAAWREVTNL